tara:strand:- start:15619 stop:15933 length:315 start_codon:yes stop_codon:yes gene_type:complete
MKNINQYLLFNSLDNINTLDSLICLKNNDSILTNEMADAFLKYLNKYDSTNPEYYDLSVNDIDSDITVIENHNFISEKELLSLISNDLHEDYFSYKSDFIKHYT